MRKLISGMLLFFCFNNTDGQDVGIGTATTGYPLNFADANGDKISLFGNFGNHYRLGV